MTLMLDNENQKKLVDCLRLCKTVVDALIVGKDVGLSYNVADMLTLSQTLALNIKEIED